MTQRANQSRAPVRAHGYSIAELLVVLAIIVLMIALSIPAYRALHRSVTETSSQVNLQQALTVASAFAERSAPGDDVVAAFTYGFDHRVQAIIMKRVGTLVDQVGTSSVLVERDVFVPVSELDPVEFDQGWWIFGMASEDTIQQQEVGTFNANGSPVANPPMSGWYDGNRYNSAIRNWLFPETHFSGQDDGNLGRDRQTFVVRFEGATGRRRVDALGTILLVLPVESDAFRNTQPWDDDEIRLDNAANIEATVRLALHDKQLFPDTVSGQADLRRILGDIATDTVLARPVTQLAIVDARRAVSELGALRRNRETDCFYKLSTGDPPTPEIDTGLFPSLGSAFAVTGILNEWIEHNNASLPNSEFSARMFTVEVADGTAAEIFP